PSLAVRGIERNVLCDLPLPAVAVIEQSSLVVKELLAGFGGELEVRSLHDGIDRTGFLAETAIDALHHVDVVARRPSGSVVASRARLDGDGKRRADRLAELAGDASFLPVRVAPERVLAAEPRAQRALFIGIVHGRLGREEVAHGDDERLDELDEKDRSRCAVLQHPLPISLRVSFVPAPARENSRLPETR